MDLSKLIYFRTAVEASSLRRAAELLHLSPAAISKTLRQLEREFSVQLFLPSGRGLTLTEDGHKLYALSTRLLAEYDSLRKQFDRLPTEGLPIRLGTYCYFTSYLLEELWEKFLDDSPLYLRRSGPGDLERELLERKIDVGITYLPFPNEDLDFLPAGEFGMRVYAAGPRFDGVPLAEIPFVTSVAEIPNTVLGVRSLDGWPHPHLPRQLRYQVPGLDSALALCRRGLAALYCPDFVARLHNRCVLESLRLEPLPLAEVGASRFTVYLVKRKSDPETRPLKRIAMGLRALCNSPAPKARAAKERSPVPC